MPESTQYEQIEQLVFAPMNETAVQLMLDWRYPPPYDIYNATAAGPEAIAENRAYLLNPDNHFYRILLPDDSFAAFCSFGEDGQVPGGNYTKPALDIGLGVRPDLTGRGLGETFVQAVIQFAGETFQPICLRVTIAAFNMRAQRVWQKQGFVPVETFEAVGSKRPFTIFTRPIT